MKTVFCRVLKVPQPGDEIRLCYTDSERGGRTESCYVCKDIDFWRVTDSPTGKTRIRHELADEVTGDMKEIVEQRLSDDDARAMIAGRLADTFNATWLSDIFNAKSRGDMVVMTCANDKMKFYPMHNGTRAVGADYIEVSE